MIERAEVRRRVGLDRHAHALGQGEFLGEGV